jgi:hypothetical protein
MAIHMTTIMTTATTMAIHMTTTMTMQASG